jgi:CMP-N,N'-diacetyllegionaminic acid synthase
MKIVGLIPARGGSKRLPGKNLRPLAGLPLIAHTIRPALESGIFSSVIVSTDEESTAETARRFGAEVPFLRPPELAGDRSPDIEWILHALGYLAGHGSQFDAFAILRPTSPFRTPATFQRAWETFISFPGADSLRAVEACRQHPGKMWTLTDGLLKPLLDDGGANPPWHSSATQSLPPVYAQNASLEIAWTRVPLETGTIAGRVIAAFLTKDFEGFDINNPEDFLLAEALVQNGLVPTFQKTSQSL